MHVHAFPGYSGAEIGRGLGVTTQAVALLAAKLEAQGPLERRTHPRHRNVKELHLTAAGLDALQAAEQGDHRAGTTRARRSRKRSTASSYASCSKQSSSISAQQHHSARANPSRYSRSDAASEGRPGVTKVAGVTLARHELAGG